MRFRVQVNNSPDAAEHTLATRLRTELEALDFESPGHLMETLRATAAKHMPHLVVGQHTGITNVHGRHGILLRIRSID